MNARLQLATSPAQRITLFKELIENMETLEEVTKRLYQAREASYIDYLNSKAARLQAEIDLIRAQSTASEKKPDTTPVVVAAVDIPRVRTITAEDVTVQQWPKKVLPEGILTSVEQAVGRVALSSMLPGEPLFEKKLASREAGLEALIPEGMRAYTIQTKAAATNVAGFILPGNRVDVLLHLRGQANDDSGGGSTVTLLQSVEVLAVGQALDRVPDVQSVTLLVTLEQATKLDLGQTSGNLSLALRNPVDKKDAKPPPAILKDLRYRQEPPLVLPEETDVPEEPREREPRPWERGPDGGNLIPHHGNLTPNSGDLIPNSGNSNPGGS
ncbi:MAG: Flp pilus assembly protein CpaB [Planctomycetota bacterium]